MAKQKGNLTNWAFLVGAVLAILVGIGQAAQADFVTSAAIPVILVLLGLVVGFVNITTKEAISFLVAAIALIALGGAGLNAIDSLIPKLGTLLAQAVQAFAFFVGAAAVVVAVKTAWNLASSK